MSRSGCEFAAMPKFVPFSTPLPTFPPVQLPGSCASFVNPPSSRKMKGMHASKLPAAIVCSGHEKSRLEGGGAGRESGPGLGDLGPGGRGTGRVARIHVTALHEHGVGADGILHARRGPRVRVAGEDGDAEAGDVDELRERRGAGDGKGLVEAVELRAHLDPRPPDHARRDGDGPAYV